MSKIIYSMSVSLDGYIETPNRSLDWVMVDEELHTFFNNQEREMDAFLYGRRMYEIIESAAGRNPHLQLRSRLPPLLFRG